MDDRKDWFEAEILQAEYLMEEPDNICPDMDLSSRGKTPGFGEHIRNGDPSTAIDIVEGAKEARSWDYENVIKGAAYIARNGTRLVGDRGEFLEWVEDKYGLDTGLLFENR